MSKEGFIEIIISCLHLGVKDSALHGKVKKKSLKKPFLVHFVGL